MLALRPRRYRSSTSASSIQTSKATEVLQSLLFCVAATLRVPGTPDIDKLLEDTRKIHQHLAASAPPRPPQDDFRHLSGFQQLLDVLRAYSGFYNPQKRTQAEKQSLFDLLHVVLTILSTTFRENPGNRRYFEQRVEGGGWEALEQIIASIGFGGSDADLWTTCQLFGKLLSFALDDQRLDELCRSVAETSLTVATASPKKKLERGKNGGDKSANQNEETGQTSSDPRSISSTIKTILGPHTLVVNPEIFRTIVGFWESLPRNPGSETSPASMIVLSTLSSLANASFYNLTALHATGILSRFLRLAFAEQAVLADAEKEEILPLCRALMCLGVNQLADAQFLLSRHNLEASDFCLSMTEKHHGPPFLQFDLSLHGFSSVELPSVGRPFPPLSTAGYTMTAWIRIDRFDPESHTTLFGLFDVSQTCFMLVYIERNTHNLILQTSSDQKRPSVRFRLVAFDEGKWYHIALVHRKPKDLGWSKAYLYINGEFSEQQRTSYPKPPPLSNASTESFSSFSSIGSTSKINPVQAFVGTPRGLPARVGSGLVFSKWSLAAYHLFEDVLSDDMLAVHYRLGPRYQGNFQDCLGGFQTYEASAALGLRDDFLNPSKDEYTDIVRVIRDKGSKICPESKLLISTLPRAIFRADGSYMETMLFRNLSRLPASNLTHAITKTGTAVAMNGAVSNIGEALLRSNGTAILSGDPVLATPFHFDENLWRLAGFTPLALKLVEQASNGEELVRAVQLTLQCLTHSWRNSEAMERDHGYPILSMLLRAKLGLANGNETNLVWRLPLTSEARDRLGFQLLGIILHFVGYNSADPIESFITNPLAYRILLVDLDAWRRSAPMTQELYYQQFSTFAVDSKYHQFNKVRLLRMRIVKRLLDALKAETMSEGVMPAFLASFESLVRCTYNAEVHRAVALFITWAFHSPATTLSRTPQPATSASRAGTTTSIPSPSTSRRPVMDASSSSLTTASSDVRFLTRRQLGVRLLEMYSGLLCEKDNLVNVRKFAKAVTNKVIISTHDEATRYSALLSVLHRPKKSAMESRTGCKHPKQGQVLTASQWLLYLLAEDDPEVVVYGCKILARLLVTQPAEYANKFATRTGGFTILAHRLKSWWDMATLWPILLSILFRYDVANIDFDKPFEFFSLVELFGDSKVSFPQVLPVIMAMLKHGLRDMLRYQEDPESPADAKSPKSPVPEQGLVPTGRPRARSMELGKALEPRRNQQPERDRIKTHAFVLQAVVRFLADMHGRSANFRDFTVNSDYVRLLLGVLYPVVVSTDPVSPDVELNSKDSALTFEGGDVIMRPVPGSKNPATPIVRSVVWNEQQQQQQPSPASPGINLGRGTCMRRPSSFILVSQEPSAKSGPDQQSAPARINHVMLPKKKVVTQQVSNVVLEGLLELVIGVFTDQILGRKEFDGFGLFLKVPPGFREHQAYFESYMLRNTITQLTSQVQLDRERLLTEPRVLQNLARFNLHMLEAIMEGWFMNGAGAMLDLCGTLLEYLQRPEVCSLKSVRLCSNAMAQTRTTFVKLALLRLSDMDDSQQTPTDAEAVQTMERLLYWQTVLLGCLGSSDDEHLKLLCFQLYNKLIDPRPDIRSVAASLWRVILVQKPQDSRALIRQQCPPSSPDMYAIAQSFCSRLTEEDDVSFLDWVDKHRLSLDMVFLGGLSRIWEDFVAAENGRTNRSAASRVKSRKEKLRQWQQEIHEGDAIILRHETANTAWMKSIYYSEHFKHQRLQQDQQDDGVFLGTEFARMERELGRPGGVFGEPQQMATQWKLDRTEGRNRMRLRMLPDYPTETFQAYQPKPRKKTTASQESSRPAAGTGGSSIGSTPATTVFHSGSASLANGEAAAVQDEANDNGNEDAVSDKANSKHGVAPEDEFEMIKDPLEPEAGDDIFEDKHRKVIRRLQAGDTIQSICNVSRIVGLDACEGILILGKDALYMMDGLFRCADNDIINVWQAPANERDPFTVLIAGGNKRVVDPTQPKEQTQQSRDWKWADVLSISKRRFLFRDVALEMFFTDGRSYLLTAINAAMRDELHARLVARCSHTASASQLPNPEDGWRLGGLKLSEDPAQSSGPTGALGAALKLGNLFNPPSWSPMMRRWQKGDISNFTYLMLINTMAGRTFNDLTQYPVFPWVIADYTSQELDLDKPASFRDLSKPMGAQSKGRAADFAMRYASLAEMGETPFHYGTHYSSAMIVSSYLIRLPPFVHSYMLLQGGHFDHPDRLFHSIEGAWRSASREAGSDVRELIPEFFYLPEFLTNVNGYNFGLRQGTAGPVDHVELPPWAKGDPKIFIAKNREALESPYVSQKLHSWIDLVFGCKQRGEAAVEALNVFHPLSYRGATDLDTITDEQERRVTTGIIHNFGQTPAQVFARPHPPREVNRCAVKRMDTSIHALTRVPQPLLESHERVSHLVYAPRLDRLLCAPPLRANLGPHYDKFVEWGFADNSVRFFSGDGRKQPLGLFENLHIGQLSAVAFADSRTLVTCGEDCVVSVHGITRLPNGHVDLVPRRSLFGHKTPVSAIAVSNALGTMLTVSQDGVALLWDLNRLEFIRRLPGARPVECARIHDVTGEIVLATGAHVALFTLNGELVLEQDVCGADDANDFVLSVAFYEGAGSEWVEEFLIFTGHKCGRVNVWRKRVGKKGAWFLELMRRLDHASVGEAGRVGAISGILVLPQVVYTGDEEGRVYEWNIVQRER